jgi:hypothetical protein
MALLLQQPNIVTVPVQEVAQLLRLSTSGIKLLQLFLLLHQLTTKMVLVLVAAQPLLQVQLDLLVLRKPMLHRPVAMAVSVWVTIFLLHNLQLVTMYIFQKIHILTKVLMVELRCHPVLQVPGMNLVILPIRSGPLRQIQMPIRLVVVLL